MLTGEREYFLTSALRHFNYERAAMRNTITTVTTATGFQRVRTAHTHDEPLILTSVWTTTSARRQSQMHLPSLTQTDCADQDPIEGTGLE